MQLIYNFYAIFTPRDLILYLAKAHFACKKGSKQMLETLEFTVLLNNQQVITR